MVWSLTLSTGKKRQPDYGGMGEMGNSCRLCRLCGPAESNSADCPACALSSEKADSDENSRFTKRLSACRKGDGNAKSTAGWYSGVVDADGHMWQLASGPDRIRPLGGTGCAARPARRRLHRHGRRIPQPQGADSLAFASQGHPDASGIRAFSGQHRPASQKLGLSLQKPTIRRGYAAGLREVLERHGVAGRAGRPLSRRSALCL